MANTKKTNSTKSTNTKKSSTTKKTTTKKVGNNEVKKTTTKKIPTAPKENKKEIITEVKKEVVKKQTFSSFVKENSRIIILSLVCILLVINIILVLLGHKVKLSDGKEIIASIDGKEITAEELFDKMKQQNGSDVLLSIVDNSIIKKELNNDDLTKAKKEAQTQVDTIKNQYESAGYKWDEVLANYGYENEDKLLNEFLDSIKKEIVAKKYLEEKLTDEEIKKYYDESVYGKYTVKHILIKPDTNTEMNDEEVASKEEEALNKANEVIEKLNNGEDWATLVSEYSEDEGSKDNEGLIENFTKGDVVDEFFNASVALENGKYSSEPVKSEFGYHVILKVSSEDKKALDELKDEIKNTLVEKKLTDDANLYTNTWKDIRKKYKLSIEDSAIKNAYEKTNE